MPDIGDEIQIETTITVDDALFDPSTVILTVIDPAGAETNPSVNNPSTGYYVATKVADQAGRWLWRWNTTNPDGVDWGYTDVGLDPPSGPLALATINDLQARIGTLTAAQAARAPALLDDASALVRAETRQQFSLIADDVATVRTAGQVITLPQRPVVSVSGVTAVGVPPTQDLVMPEGSWVFDGIDKIIIQPHLGWILNLPEVWSSNDWAGAGTYRVTYTHGSAIVPPEVKGLICSMVNRTLTAPSISDLVSESIGSGDYAWQANQSVGAMGASVRLTAGDRAKLESWGYIRSYGMTETVVR